MRNVPLQNVTSSSCFELEQTIIFDQTLQFVSQKHKKNNLVKPGSS